MISAAGSLCLTFFPGLIVGEEHDGESSGMGKSAGGAAALAEVWHGDGVDTIEGEGDGERMRQPGELGEGTCVWGNTAVDKDVWGASVAVYVTPPAAWIASLSSSDKTLSWGEGKHF